MKQNLQKTLTSSIYSIDIKRQLQDLRLRSDTSSRGLVVPTFKENGIFCSVGFFLFSQFVPTTIIIFNQNFYTPLKISTSSVQM